MTVIVNSESVIVIDRPKTHTVYAGGAQGPRGINGLNGAGALEFTFGYGDASPDVITTALAGKLIYSVQIHIKMAFDGAGAALKIGDDSQLDRLMLAAENDPTQVGSYTTAPAKSYGVDTVLKLSITPGAGSTQGSGLIVLYIQQ